MTCTGALGVTTCILARCARAARHTQPAAAGMSAAAARAPPPPPPPPPGHPDVTVSGDDIMNLGNNNVHDFRQTSRSRSCVEAMAQRRQIALVVSVIIVMDERIKKRFWFKYKPTNIRGKDVKFIMCINYSFLFYVSYNY